jgi:hypothetical protein
VSDLAAFLLARIEREEQFARFVGDDKPQWHLYDGDAVTSDDGTTLVAECQMRSDAEHIVRWDPARVLAECDAKRRILAEHEPGIDLGEAYCITCTPTSDSTGAPMVYGNEWPCRTMRALTLPYADHPDYDEAWRP